MEEIIKIREVSLKYDVSARTLRYYEDIGLINSIRSEDYAYRMYDATAIKKLEQILILRKLNVSIKDIQRIFVTTDSSVVLEVLAKKTEGIDEEVALLHELKDIIQQFIHQIETLNFTDAADVKLLYEKAKEIEGRLAEKEYHGNPGSTNPGRQLADRINETDVEKLTENTAERLSYVSERLKRGPEVRIVELPKCRMATSGYDTFDKTLGDFDKWWPDYDKKRKGISFSPLDFLWFEDGYGVWWMAVENDAVSEDTGGYDIIDFEGGIYAAAISVDGDDDINGRVYEGIKRWIETSGFDLDERNGHRTMCHMIITENIKKGLGYDQLDIYVPIRLKAD